MRLIILFSLLLPMVFGQVGGSPYLKLGMDARGISMGRSITSLANGPSAVYWNPAGLYTSRKLEFGILTTNLIDSSPWNQDYQTIAVSVSWWRIGIGFGTLRYGVSQIPEYDYQMNYLGDFDDHELTGIISFAMDFPGLMTVGVSGIYSQQQYVGLTQWDKSLESGAGLNFGLQFYPLTTKKNIRLGMLINNRNSVGAIDSTSLFTHVGMEWKINHLFSQNFLNSMTLVIGFEQEHNFPLKLNGGAEISIANLPSSHLLGRIGFDDLVLEMRSLDTSLKTHESELSNQIRRLNLKYTFGIGLEQAIPGTKRVKVRMDYALVRETFRFIHFFTLGFIISK